MTSETEIKIHQCECDVCRAGIDPETVGHHRRMNVFLSRLHKPQRRWYVGLLSQHAGSPSDRQLSKITGLDEKTIQRGRQEFEDELVDLPLGRQRQEGGGRPQAEKRTPS